VRAGKCWDSTAHSPSITIVRVMTPHPGGGIVGGGSRDATCVARRWIEGHVPSHYELTVKGQPGELLRAAFEDVVVSSAPGVTVLSAKLDQSALHGLLARIEDLGLELLDVRLVTDAASSTTNEERS
jgi:hypothetical protein